MLLQISPTSTEDQLKLNPYPNKYTYPSVPFSVVCCWSTESHASSKLTDRYSFSSVTVTRYQAPRTRVSSTPQRAAVDRCWLLAADDAADDADVDEAPDGVADVLAAMAAVADDVEVGAITAVAVAALRT